MRFPPARIKAIETEGASPADRADPYRGSLEKAATAGRSKAEAVWSIAHPGYPEIKPLFRTLGNGVAGFYDEMSAGRK